MSALNEYQAFCANSAPHPPFGHLLPASGEKDTSMSLSLRHKYGETARLSLRSGERVPEGRVRGERSHVSCVPLASQHA